MNNITKLNIKGDTVYIKKSVLGYRVVHPIIDPETKKVNKFNLITGGWDNLLLILFILFMTLTFYIVYWNDTNEMLKVVRDPCSYCGTDILLEKYNLTNLNNGGEQE